MSVLCCIVFWGTARCALVHTVVIRGQDIAKAHQHFRFQVFRFDQILFQVYPRFALLLRRWRFVACTGFSVDRRGVRIIRQFYRRYFGAVVVFFETRRRIVIVIVVLGICTWEQTKVLITLTLTCILAVTQKNIFF